ncbi:MAG: hypothetical protein AAF810_15035 [Cyanobacteria bacterium P01_D01_bin.36]
MTRLTIDIPETLAEELNHYLSENPEETMAKILREALHVRQVPKDRSALLELAGVIKEAPRGAAEHAEDFA